MHTNEYSALPNVERDVIYGNSVSGLNDGCLCCIDEGWRFSTHACPAYYTGSLMCINSVEKCNQSAIIIRNKHYNFKTALKRRADIYHITFSHICYCFSKFNYISYLYPGHVTCQPTKLYTIVESQYVSLRLCISILKHLTFLDFPQFLQESSGTGTENFPRPSKFIT